MTGKSENNNTPQYYVDQGWYERHGRSLEHMIESRVAVMELPPAKSGTKRSKAVSKGLSLERLAKIEGFVSPDQTILEAVFRLLLVHENKPLEVEQIAQELAERGIGVRDARVIRPDVLLKMLDHDRHYGITRATIG